MTIAALHLVATAFMAGVIVFVQIVHYPLFGGVGRSEFPAYHRRHTARTGWVVGPPMLIELCTALWLAAFPASDRAADLAYVGLALLAVIWLSTALLQVPDHGRISRGFDAKAHRRLVHLNWLRTVAWLARIGVAVALTEAPLGP